MSAGARQLIPVVAIDKTWTTFGGTIPVAALAKSLTDAKIPEPLSNIAIYRVIAQREEKDAAGKWVNPTEIQPLDINQLMALPPVTCDFNDRQAYKTWAEMQPNEVMIAEPSFYTILQGDIWYEPGAVDPNDRTTQVVGDPFDKNNPLAFKGDYNTLLPDEKKAYDDAVAKKALIDQRHAHTPQPSNTPPVYPSNPYVPGGGGGPGGRGGTGGSGGAGGRGGGGGGGRNAVPDQPPQNPGNMLMPPGARGYIPGGRPPGYPPNPYSPDGRLPGMDGGNPNGGGTSSVASLPQGSFSPAERIAAATAAGTSPDIKIWVHDVTVQAGKTYRYKLKYVLSNPVAGTKNTCENPADADKAYIESDWSDWSKDISVESDSNFYAIDYKHGIHFDIFKWKNGIWQMQTVYCNPGDRIGSVDTTAAHTDFDTGWTLVDVREDPEKNDDNKVLVLISDNGTIKEKEISSDRRNSEYRKLLGEVMQTREKTASTAGPPTGGTPRQ